MSPGQAQFLMAVSFAVPCFTMGLKLLDVWRDPMAVENGRWVRLGIGIFVLEFVLLHAGVAVGSVAVRADGGGLGSALLMTGFYSLFGGGIALGFKSRMLFLSFLQVIVGRYIAMLIGVEADDPQLIQAHSVMSTLIYFPMVISSVFLPWPRRGITELIAAQTRVPNASGIWIDEPHRAIGPAAIYFLLLGVAELAVMTWVDPRVFRMSGGG